MGWNSVSIKRRAPALADVPDGSHFYFVHSFHVVPEDKSVIATTTEYGAEFVSSIWKDNIFASQFHPEKSQALGAVDFEEVWRNERIEREPVRCKGKE